MLQGHANMIGMYIFTIRWLFTKNIFSCSVLFQLQINENNRNMNSHKQIKS